jgi:D-alanine--poly(phosphoribitol) ligase subunit 1
MALLENIRHWSEVAPLHPAHRSRGRVLTHGELRRSSDSLAAYLSRELPDDHSPVAVLGHKEPEMLVAFLAAVQSGHPYIPLDVSFPPARVDTILARSGTAVCLTPSRVQELLSGPARALPREAEWKIRAQDPWYIIFTSGSTGEPKGVVITAACLDSFVNWMLAEQGFSNRQEVFLNQAPFSFDLSVMDLYLSLTTGGTLCSLTQEEIADPRQMFLFLAASGVTVWVSTPSFCQMCLREPAFSARMLPSLRRFLFCGETLAPEVAGDLMRRFPSAEIWNTYGPTEATCATTSVRITARLLSSGGPLPVGRPKPGSRIVISRPDGGEAAEGERGEILISGESVSPGYLGRPDLNEKAFFQQDGQRAYRTGDLGHFQGEMLFFDGRKDDQIKLHGYRIELGDVEANLRALPQVQDAVVLARLKAGLPDSLTAFVILRPVPPQSEFERAQQLKRQLAQRLPAYMLPRKITFVEGFPLTANGKADRRKLAEMLE